MVVLHGEATNVTRPDPEMQSKPYGKMRSTKSLDRDGVAGRPQEEAVADYRRTLQRLRDVIDHVL